MFKYKKILVEETEIKTHHRTIQGKLYLKLPKNEDDKITIYDWNANLLVGILDVYRQMKFLNKRKKLYDSYEFSIGSMSNDILNLFNDFVPIIYDIFSMFFDTFKQRFNFYRGISFLEFKPIITDSFISLLYDIMNNKRLFNDYQEDNIFYTITDWFLDEVELNFKIYNLSEYDRNWESVFRKKDVDYWIHENIRAVFKTFFIPKQLLEIIYNTLKNHQKTIEKMYIYTKTEQYESDNIFSYKIPNKWYLTGKYDKISGIDYLIIIESYNDYSDIDILGLITVLINDNKFKEKDNYLDLVKESLERIFEYYLYCTEIPFDKIKIIFDSF